MSTSLLSDHNEWSRRIGLEIQHTRADDPAALRRPAQAHEDEARRLRSQAASLPGRESMAVRELLIQQAKSGGSFRSVERLHRALREADRGNYTYLRRVSGFHGFATELEAAIELDQAEKGDS